MNKPNTKRTVRENWQLVYLIAFALLGFTAIFSPTFRTVTNIKNLIIQITPLLLVGLGQSLVIFTGGIDLSVGTLMSLITVILATAMPRFGILPSITIALIVAAIFGFVNGIIVSKVGIDPFITTLASMTIAQGIALYILPGPGGSISLNFSRFVIGIEPLGLPLYTWIAFLVFLMMAIAIYRSEFGLNVFAVGGNKEAAYFAGVPVDWITTGVYICSSLLTCVAGILLSARIASGDPLVGSSFALDSIGAAVVGGASLSGGRGGALGALGGAIIIGSVSNLLNMLSVNPYWQFILKSVIIVGSIAIALWFECARVKEG